MNKIYIVGMGPGFESMMTKQAIDALEESDVIVGYTVYIKLLGVVKSSFVWNFSPSSFIYTVYPTMTSLASRASIACFVIMLSKPGPIPTM